MRIAIVKDRRGRVISIEASGHACYADEGQDIVCAAVSTLMQSLEVGLSEILGLAVLNVKKKGFMRLTMPDDIPPCKEDRAHFLVAVVTRSLAMIEQKYSEYIILEEVLPGSGKNSNRDHAS